MISILEYERTDRYGNLVKFTYSAEDYELISAHTWNIESYGYVRTSIKIEGKYVVKKLHRLILGEPLGKIVDHRNGNKLDCTRDNLRVTDSQGNAQNVGLSRRNTSGQTGVRSHAGRWEARLWYRRKYIHLGSFTTKEEAVLARLTGEAKYYKEYSRNNSKQGVSNG